MSTSSESPGTTLRLAHPPAPTDATPDEPAVAHVLAAAGRLLGWCGAVLWRHCPETDESVVAGQWRADEACGCGRRPAPVWGRRIPRITWNDKRVLWRAGPRRQGVAGHAGLAVPVRLGTEVVGVLTYHGPAIAEPDEAVTALLEAVAALLARHYEPRPAPALTAVRPPQHETLERAISLVDVFAFTAEVLPDGGLTWWYFGPNSQAVFGGPVTSEDSVTALMNRYVHPEDVAAVQQFVEASVAGRAIETEARVVGLDGLTRWVSWRGVPRREDGRLFVDGVATDVTARRNLTRTHQDLLLAREKYVRRVDMIRQHDLIVRDANDNVLQRIFAAGLRLQILQRRLSDVEAHAAAAIAFQLDQAANDIREIIFGLNLKVLDHGFEEALGKSVERAARSLGFEPEVRVLGDVEDVDPVVANAAVGAVEQALSNVVRHAEARAVSVEVLATGGTLRVTVADDGKGFGAEPLQRRGLDSVVRSASALGGSASWRSEPGSGVTVVWQVPLAEEPGLATTPA